MSDPNDLNRPTRRSERAKAKGTNASAMWLFIGAGGLVLVAAVVVVALFVVGRPKGTDSAQQDSDHKAEPAKTEPIKRRASVNAPVPSAHAPEPPDDPPLMLTPGPDVESPPTEARDKVPTIIAGGNKPFFKDLPPAGGLLIGLEFGLGKFNTDDVIQAGRPIYRVGDKEVYGIQRGTNLARLVTLKAREGYAVGAITCKYGLNFDGCSLTFMKVSAGRLDPTDSYESEWVGYDGPKRPVKLGGDGIPIVGLAGKASDTQLHGLGPLFKGQEAWDPGKYGANEIILGSRREPPFRDEAPSGGLLVGFDVYYGTFSNYDVIHGVRPLYRTRDKETRGELHGRETDRGFRVVAKPGYAVGGLIVKAGLGMDAFTVVFMKIRGDKLDPDDSYQSEKFGGPGGDSHPMLGGDGTPVTGIIGRTNKNSGELNGLGLAFPAKK